ncbi:MAG: MarR family transcriptional regulator [Myxococcota bacterium]
MGPDQQFGRLLKRVHQIWHQVINERLRPRGVSHSQWRVVLEVSRSAGPMTQSALASELGVESPTMVRLLDRLEDKGWIARTPCPTDRRARYVALTPKAQRLATELEVVVGEIRRTLLQDLRSGELAGCIAALSKVEARALEALAATARERAATRARAAAKTTAGKSARNGGGASARSDDRKGGRTSAAAARVARATPRRPRVAARHAST